METVKNMMRAYLGDDYSSNHLKNFCLYWMKGRETRPKWENTEEYKECFDEWRCRNDLACLYFRGDLRADTLMRAWTPIKWVAEYFNRDYGMRFCKEPKDDPDHYLRLLADDRDAYLPPKHELTRLLDRFLELAELRCNYILHPDIIMNCAKYCCSVNGRRGRLYDEVPVMLYHIFDAEWWFGKDFYYDNHVEDIVNYDAVEWVKRECLECGFENGIIDQEHMLPLVKGFPAGDAKWLKEEEEIKEALEYMIKFLEARQLVLEKNPYIMLVGRYGKRQNDALGYVSKLICGEALLEDGTPIMTFTETEYFEVRDLFNLFDDSVFTTVTDHNLVTEATVRSDYANIFRSKRARGRNYFTVLHKIAVEMEAMRINDSDRPKEITSNEI